MIRKILRTLLGKLQPKAITIDKSKNIDKLKLNEVLANLQIFKSHRKKRNLRALLWILSFRILK